MTYCVGIKLSAGLVFLSDSRTNAGVDNISTFRKMIVYERAGDRCMVLLSAGNLSIAQSVREILQVEQLQERPDMEPLTIWNARSMFDAARVLGNAVRHVYERDAEALKHAGVEFNVSLVFGGQIRDPEPARIAGIVRGDRLAGPPMAGHRHQDVMVPQPPRAVAVEHIQRVDHRAGLGQHARLLAQFAQGGLRQPLARLDLATRKAPEPGIGRVDPPHQQHLGRRPAQHHRDHRSHRAQGRAHRPPRAAHVVICPPPSTLPCPRSFPLPPLVARAGREGQRGKGNVSKAGLGRSDRESMAPAAPHRP